MDSSPDWFGSNQDLDDQTDVIRARLSNTKYDIIFSVLRDYNVTLVEGIYNIVIPNLAGQKPGDSVKHFWKAPRQLDDHWPWVGLGTASAGNVMEGSREMGRLWGLLGRC